MELADELNELEDRRDAKLLELFTRLLRVRGLASDATCFVSDCAILGLLGSKLREENKFHSGLIL